MSRTYIHKCDRCGKEETNNEFKPKTFQLWNVSIYVTERPVATYDPPQHREEWCRECCVAVGILGPYNEADNEVVKKAPSPPSFEDLLRDMIREEIQEVTP